jgi:hypothetical protein
LEAERIRGAAKDLVPISGDGTSQYVVIPRSTHVSILFDGTAMSVAQKWAAQVLRLQDKPALPSHRGVLGFFLGFVGILMLAGPFLREALQPKKHEPQPAENVVVVPQVRAFLEYGIAGLGAVGLLSLESAPRAAI